MQTQPNGLKTGTLLRHAGAVLLLFLAWHHLSNWLQFLHPKEYWIFGFFFIGALLLAAGPELFDLLKRVPRLRLILVCAFIVLALPWGEWLRLNFATSREDWTRQLFKQACFLYALFLFFSIFPHAAEWFSEKGKRLLQRVSARLFWLPCLLFFGFSSWVSLFIFKQTPFVQDSAAYLFQAKIFSQFHWFAPAPPVPDFFSYQGDMLVMKDGRWFAMYLPGYSALLGMAMLAHAEWLLSPCLGTATLTIWMIYVRRWHDRSLSFLFGLLFLFSPFIFLMFSTVMIHSLELFVASATIYICRRETEGTSLLRLFALFLTLFVGVVGRGFSLLPFLVPVLAYTCWQKLTMRRWLFPLFLLSGIVFGIGVVCLYQWKTTGDPWVPGYNLEGSRSQRYGFGKSIAGQIHTPLRGFENVSNNLQGINTWLTGWYSGSLSFLILFFFAAPRFQTWERLLLLSSILLILFYYFYPLQDLVFGPRFYFPLAPILLLFIARIALTQQVPSRATALLIVSFLSFLPGKFPAYLRGYTLANSKAANLKEATQQLGHQKTILFLDRHGGSHFVSWNDPFLRNPVLFCLDLRERNPEAMRAFQGYRPAYFRLDVGFQKSKLQGGYGLSLAPDEHPAGFLSLFELGLALQSGRDYPDQDCFDLCYSGLFTSPEASDQLKYLEGLEHKPGEQIDYKKRFRSGLIHAARMMLLPKQAFERKGTAWKSLFDPELFRRELQASVDNFRAAGAIGEIPLGELNKVQRRIDQSDDGRFSNDEVYRFLTDKVRILEMQ